MNKEISIPAIFIDLFFFLIILILADYGIYFCFLSVYFEPFHSHISITRLIRIRWYILISTNIFALHSLFQLLSPSFSY